MIEGGLIYMKNEYEMVVGNKEKYNELKPIVFVSKESFNYFLGKSNGLSKICVPMIIISRANNIYLVKDFRNSEEEGFNYIRSFGIDDVNFDGNIYYIMYNVPSNTNGYSSIDLLLIDITDILVKSIVNKENLSAENFIRNFYSILLSMVDNTIAYKKVVKLLVTDGKINKSEVDYKVVCRNIKYFIKWYIEEYIKDDIELINFANSNNFKELFCD